MRAGADFIKVTNTGGGLVPGNGTAYLQFDRKALRLIIDEAAKLGVHVAVHSLSTAGIAEVVEARPRTVEHLTFHKSSDEEVEYDAGWSTGWWSAASRDVRSSWAGTAARTRRSVAFETTWSRPR